MMIYIVKVAVVRAVKIVVGMLITGMVEVKVEIGTNDGSGT